MFKKSVVISRTNFPNVTRTRTPVVQSARVIFRRFASDTDEDGVKNNTWKRGKTRERGKERLCEREKGNLVTARSVARGRDRPSSIPEDVVIHKNTRPATNRRPEFPHSPMHKNNYITVMPLVFLRRFRKSVSKRYSNVCSSVET